MQAPLPLLSPTRSAVAQVLSELLPGVDTTVVDWGRWDTDGDPRYRRRSIAFAGGELVAKFALSDEAAGPIAREGRILEILGKAGLPVPEVVARHPDVSCFVTRRVPGAPVTANGLGRLAPDELERFAGQLVDVLVSLRSPHLRPQLASLAHPGRFAPKPMPTS